MSTSRKPSSIHLRLLAASLLILPLFLGVTIWVLDRAFSEYQLASQQESMRLQQLLLAKAADWDGEKWAFSRLDEPRLELLDSGLYAFLLSLQGEVLWHSPSAGQMANVLKPDVAISEVLFEMDLPELSIGQQRFSACLPDRAYFCQGTRVAWGSAGPEGIFMIVRSQADMVSARSAYRAYLLWLSLGTAVLLLLAQSLVVRWGLLPLRRIAAGIKRLESGEADELGGSYPSELVPLTDNINVLLASEKTRRERVRNTMDRLTHVLKTPLMLIRNSVDKDPQFRQLVDTQVTRMLGIVEGELARARLDGRVGDLLGKPIPVRPVLLRIAEAYSRLPRLSGDAEPVDLEIDTADIWAGAFFRGEERDLQDLFGSVLENSLRYCRRRINVTARAQREAGQDWLVITIGDDGDGVPPGLEREVLNRGARADTAHPGQGLGLSIVIEIISAYGGGLQIAHSELGGALFVIRLPGAASKTA